MKTFVFDNRSILPPYFCFFLDALSVHDHIHLITPARLILAINGRVELLQNSKTISYINPKFITNYVHVEEAFDAQFINYSTGNFSFERACFLRWFAVNLATIDLHESDYICLVDSDFVMGCAPSFILDAAHQQVAATPLEFIATWSQGNSGIINPQITILTKRLLYSFCRYLFCEYFSPSFRSERLGEWFDTIGRGNPGGLCDMAALGSWLFLVKPNKFNLNDLEGLSTINNFNQFHDKQNEANRKWSLELTAEKQTLKDSNGQINLVGSHFQGSAKRWISNHRLTSSASTCWTEQSPVPGIHHLSLLSRFTIKLLLLIGDVAPYLYSIFLQKFTPLGDRWLSTTQN